MRQTAASPCLKMAYVFFSFAIIKPLKNPNVFFINSIGINDDFASMNMWLFADITRAKCLSMQKHSIPKLLFKSP